MGGFLSAKDRGRAVESLLMEPKPSVTYDVFIKPNEKKQLSTFPSAAAAKCEIFFSFMRITAPLGYISGGQNEQLLLLLSGPTWSHNLELSRQRELGRAGLFS